MLRSWVVQRKLLPCGLLLWGRNHSGDTPRGAVLHPNRSLLVHPGQNYGGVREGEAGRWDMWRGDGALGWCGRSAQTATMVCTDSAACYNIPPTSTFVEGPSPKWSRVISGKQGPVTLQKRHTLGKPSDTVGYFLSNRMREKQEIENFQMKT